MATVGQRYALHHVFPFPRKVISDLNSLNTGMARKTHNLAHFFDKTLYYWGNDGENKFGIVQYKLL